MAGTLGYKLKWNGDGIFIKTMGAGKAAVETCLNAGVEEARNNHIWQNRTFQTQEACEVIDHAKIEWPASGKHAEVWGNWGIVDRERFAPEEEDELMGDLGIMSDDGIGEFRTRPVVNPGPYGPATTKDVALFLEFGTVKMRSRPWIYPAWDATKVLLAPTLAAYLKMPQFAGAGGFEGFPA